MSDALHTALVIAVIALVTALLRFCLYSSLTGEDPSPEWCATWERSCLMPSWRCSWSIA